MLGQEVPRQASGQVLRQYSYLRATCAVTGILLIKMVTGLISTFRMLQNHSTMASRADITSNRATAMAIRKATGQCNWEASSPTISRQRLGPVHISLPMPMQGHRGQAILLPNVRAQCLVGLTPRGPLSPKGRRLQRASGARQGLAMTALWLTWPPHSSPSPARA